MNNISNKIRHWLKKNSLAQLWGILHISYFDVQSAYICLIYSWKPYLIICVSALYGTQGIYRPVCKPYYSVGDWLYFQADRIGSFGSALKVLGANPGQAGCFLLTSHIHSLIPCMLQLSSLASTHQTSSPESICMYECQSTRYQNNFIRERNQWDGWKSSPSGDE